MTHQNHALCCNWNVHYYCFSLREENQKVASILLTVAVIIIWELLRLKFIPYNLYSTCFSDHGKVVYSLANILR